LFLMKTENVNIAIVIISTGGLIKTGVYKQDTILY
jgi:hypothetical protein